MNIESIPVGAMCETPFLYPDDHLPAKWMKVEGQSLLIEEYPKLFEVIGHIYTDETITKETHFNLPNTVDPHRYYIMKVKE